VELATDIDMLDLRKFQKLHQGFGGQTLRKGITDLSLRQIRLKD
jgi:hypothetical protein